MTPLILGVLAFGGILAYGASKASAGSASGIKIATNPLIYYSNSWNLPDIDASNQGGGFDQTYDEAFSKASGQTGVPFALIKAHAIRESSLNANAYHFDNSTVGASYGLLQVEWICGSNRFDKYGVSDSQIGDGSLLYDPDTSSFLGASIIRDNLNWLKGSLRDAINAYNTGTPESKREAPNHYTNDVVKYYNQILGEDLIS